ncbi:MAG: DUF1116 domain-containing protein [Desulfurococcales archaeon]|nr:DUF1116 domain-containing protein [Desulfurococcales archaeon]
MSSIKEEVNKANKLAVERMMESTPVWVSVEEARKAIPGMKDYMLLHAGPPIDWERASGPLKGAIIGAAIYEGWASKPEEVEKMARSGQIVLEPTHEHDAVGPMAGVISPSMPVIVVEDSKFGGRVFSNFNEGIGRVLRYGAYDKQVIDRLKWIEKTLAPTLYYAISELRKDKGGLNLKQLISQALHMGDDCHNRTVAATSILIKEVAPYMVSSGADKKDVVESLKFMSENPFTALNFVMAAAKSMTKAAHGIKYSTVVTIMSRNGTEVGIKVSGLGNEWFTSRAPIPRGVYFPGFKEDDANPDIGDSAITETAGFGGFAMAAAPAIVSWVGGSVEYAIEVTKRSYEITVAEHKYFTIPYLGFKGTPTGIDVRLVVAKGITPTINTGIAHKEPGVGQIGAGIVSLPSEVFKKALREFASKYGV